MEKYKKLIFVVLILVFFGCSSKTGVTKLCNAGWSTCASDADCHCWKRLIEMLFLKPI